MSNSNEDRIVRRLTAMLSAGDGVVVGAGDDCAVVEAGGTLQLLKTDCIAEGVHFDCDCDPRLAGRKALARSMSDIAAMAGEPRFALVTAGFSELMDEDWCAAAYEGMAELCARYRVFIVGGETCRMNGAGFLSVSLTGDMPGDPVLRSGGRSGDALFVTGKLGGSLASGRHLTFEPRLREAQWLARNFRPSAMMDLSDGLAADLPRLAAASGTGYEVERQSLPKHAGCSVDSALGDGEDYELLFAIGQPHVEGLMREWPEVFPELPLTPIGLLRDGAGENFRGGYDHFEGAEA